MFLLVIVGLGWNGNKTKFYFLGFLVEGTRVLINKNSKL